MTAPPPLRVRRATAEELPAVGELTLAAYLADGYITDGSDYVHVLRDAVARDRDAEVWAAVDGGPEPGDPEPWAPEAPGAVTGSMAGTVTFCPVGSPYREVAVDDDEAEFRMLAVAVGWRRRGVARTLTQLCLDRARELGQHRLVLCSDRRMTSAHALYAGLGFVRLPDRDWSPAPGFELQAFCRDLP